MNPLYPGHLALSSSLKIFNSYFMNKRQINPLYPRHLTLSPSWKIFFSSSLSVSLPRSNIKRARAVKQKNCLTKNQKYSSNTQMVLLMENF